MNNKYLQLKALKKIIDDKVPFQTVLEKTTRENNLSSEDKIVFKLDVLGAIRHFIYLQYESVTAFPEFESDDDEIYLMILALYEIRYHSKDIALFQVIEQVRNTIEYMELRLDLDEAQARLDELAKKKTALPAEIMKDPYAYNSMFFNTPLWMVKLWALEYGDDQAMNFLLANQRRGLQFLAINTLVKSADDFLDDDRLTPSHVVATALEYRVGPCSQLEEVQSGELFAQDLSNQIMLEALDYTYNQRILHLGSISGGIAAGLALRSIPFLGHVEALFSNESRYRRGKYTVSRLGLPNLDIRYGSVDLMKTYSPYESYDLVVLTPNSSRLGQIRRRPDILVTLKEKDIGYFARNAVRKLAESSRFLAASGKLVYVVPTLTLEETEQVIEKFLKSHDDFSLEYKRQILPNEYGSDGLFFAIMKRDSR